MSMPPPPPPPPMSQGRLEEGFRPGGPRPSEERSGLVVFMNVINSITHLLLGSIACSAVFFVHLPFVSLFYPTYIKAHVYLTVIGYIILMSQAVLSFNPYNGWSSNLKYPEKRFAHWVLQILGSILALSGCLIAITNSNNNLDSAHGIVGLVAMILTAISLVGGILNLFCSEIMKLLLFKLLHACVGSLTLVFAYVALCLAFHRERSIISDTNANCAIGFTVLALLGIVVITYVNMVKNIFCSKS